MPQIAQQDYLYIDIPTGDGLTSVLSQEKATELHFQGILLDIVLRWDGLITKLSGYDYAVEPEIKVTGFSYLNDSGECVHEEY